jgi:hypothetical protein
MRLLLRHLLPNLQALGSDGVPLSLTAAWSFIGMLQCLPSPSSSLSFLHLTRFFRRNILFVGLTLPSLSFSECRSPTQSTRPSDYSEILPYLPAIQ